MKLLDQRNGGIYRGALVDTGRGYGYPVLELTPERGGKKITASPAIARSLCVVEATLNERSQLDRARYFLRIRLDDRTPRRS
jgi:hypothetical protein